MSIDFHQVLEVQRNPDRQTIMKALRYLANNDEDHAAEQNGIGFNGADSNFGHSLAAKPWLSETQFTAAYKMLQKYRSQLSKAGIELPLGLSPLPPTLTNVPNVMDAAPARPAQPKSGKRIFIQEIDGDERVCVSFGGYYPELIEKIKTIKGRQYDPVTKNWHVSLEHLAKVREMFPTFALSPELADAESRANAEREAKEQAKRAEAAKLLSVTDLDREYDFGHLREHQKSAVRAILTGDMYIAEIKPKEENRALYLGTPGRVILGDDMGLGKTKTALIAAKAYHDAFGCHIFVIAPVSLRMNWLREAQSVDARVEVYSWAKIPPAIESMKDKYVLLVDEAHYGQNLKSTRTQKMLDLVAGARAAILVTGTPMKNGRPVNMFPLLKAASHSLAADKSHFEKWFCAAGPTRFSRWDATGAAHLDDLHRLTRNVIIRRMKKECIDLPEKTRVMRPVELSADARRAYEQSFAALREKYAAGLRAKFQEAKQIRARLAAEAEVMDADIYESLQRDAAKLENAEAADAIVLMNNLRNAGSIGKAEAAVEIASELLEQGEQVVIFTEFETSAKYLHMQLGGELLTGAVASPDERQKMIDRFQNGISKVFVGTIKAGGVGITLTAAQTVILVDRPWTPGDAVQAEDRCHRIGQKNAVTAIWLQYGEIDTKVDAILEKKQERIEMVLDGKRKTMRGIDSPQQIAQMALMDVMGDLELSAERDADLSYDDESEAE